MNMYLLLTTLMVGVWSTTQALKTDLRMRGLRRAGNLGDRCQGKDCEPTYSVLNNTREYEVRKYPKFKYVVAVEEGLNFTDARRRNLWKIQRYFQGSNDRRLKMTTMTKFPSYNRFMFGGNKKLGNLFATSVLIPEEHQGNPPKPFWDDLMLMEVPEVVAFARSFGGFASEAMIIRNQRRLERDLLRSEFNFDPSVFYSAEYKGVWPPTHRHNEIVFMNPHHDFVV